MLSMSKFNSKTSKLALSLIFVATLAACGGSDDAASVVALDVPAVTVGTTPADVAAATKSVGLLVGSTVTLPALTSKEGVALAADTKLTLSAIPAGAAAGTLAGFKLTSAAGEVKEGTLIAGSCIFRVTSINGAPVTAFNITFDPCGIDVQSGGVVASGTQQNVSVSLNFGGVPILASVPVTVTVVNGQAVLTGSNGQSLTVGLATGVQG